MKMKILANACAACGIALAAHAVEIEAPKTRELVAERMCRYIEEDRERIRGSGMPDYCIPNVYDLSQDDGGSGGCKTVEGTSVEWTCPKDNNDREGPAVEIFATIRATALDGCGERLFTQASMLV